MKMKRVFVMMVMLGFAASLFSQENMISVRGGYVFGNLDEAETATNGWRIGGVYEFNPMGGNLSHGLHIGYMQTTASYDYMLGTADYTLSSWPIYYAPKYSFGNKSLKAYLKGALGMHFTNLQRTGTLTEINADEWGFYGGAGAGVTQFLGESFFLSAEYEFAYMSNSPYKNGIVNSVTAGIGMKF